MSAARQVMLSSGQILFADPTKTWIPENFPTLPSTLMSLTAAGTVESASFHTLTLSNAVSYEPYEPQGVRATLKKALQVNNTGLVTYEEPRMGFVSTIAAAFPAPVTTLTPAVNGGPGINDVLSGNPDTLTNAVAKLDAWLGNALLSQPPAATVVEKEENSLWGGVRWLNFKTYGVLDKFVPYVNSLLVMIGDPSSSDYLTLSITDPQYFPYRLFRDGISPQNAPLVRLRLFSDFFPAADNTVSYTKSVLPSKCIQILGESGNCTLPGSGKVLGIADTDGFDTYTTLSLYLPDLPTIYPKDSSVPVRIVFLNATLGEANVMLTSTLQTVAGAPGPLSTLAVTGATDSTLTYALTHPIYSDALHNVSTPYYSTYGLQYTFEQLATAHETGVGFRYGQATPATVPPALSAYDGSTFTKSYVYTGSPQSIQASGTDDRPFVPGVVWSTAWSAVNSAQLVGVATAAPLTSTLFPVLTNVSAISSIGITATYPNTRYIVRNELRQPTFNGSSGTWTISATPAPADVLYISSAAGSVTQADFRVSTTVQFNDASYPGDRSTIAVGLLYTNSDGGIGAEHRQFYASAADDFSLNTLSTSTDAAGTFQSRLLETQGDPFFQKYFYGVDLSGSQALSTISQTLQAVQFNVTNRAIASYVGPIQEQTLSSAAYTFITEPNNAPSTQSLSTNSVTDVSQVSGLYTPTPSSEFKSDLDARNFAYRYALSSFAVGDMLVDGAVAGPLTAYSTNIRILNGSLPIASLPFPQNVGLTLSSLTTRLGDAVYTEPWGPQEVAVRVTLTPAVPGAAPAVISTVLNTLYIDTVSYARATSSFSSTLGAQGQRVLSLLPRLEVPGTANNMDDGIDIYGDVGQGLNVSVSSFYTVSTFNTILVSSFVNYTNASTLSSIYTDVYSRELLYAGGQYIHPVGHNFSGFSGAALGQPSFQYPDFTFDLTGDVNYGYRYATFAVETPVYDAPTALRNLYVRVNGPSLISSISTARSYNNWWPDSVVPESLVSSLKLRMHVKLLGTYYTGTYNTVETAWLNGFKEIDQITFDDGTYDAGAVVYGSTLGATSTLEYKLAFNRRFYTKLMALVRVGIASDAGIPTNEPITFESLNVRFSDS